MSTYISEAHYSGSVVVDFIEVAVDRDTDVSGWQIEVYDGIGQHVATMSFPASIATEGGHDVYLFDKNVSGFPSLADSVSVAIVDDTGTVQQFISFHPDPFEAVNGSAAGTTPAYVGVSAGNGESVQSDDGGATYYTQTEENPGTIPCFAPGMMVECPGGPRAVETLGAGDRVLTREVGAQPVLWACRRSVVFTRADHSDRPVLVPEGTLNARRDLIVSGQHRLLFCAGAPGDEDLLIPAKACLGFRGIRQMRGQRQITWHHFALGAHHAVRVNGVWAESLLLGPVMMRGLPRRDRRFLERLFGDGTIRRSGRAPLNGPMAYRCLTPREGRTFLKTRQPGGRRKIPVGSPV